MLGEAVKVDVRVLKQSTMRACWEELCEQGILNVAAHLELLPTVEASQLLIIRGITIELLKLCGGAGSIPPSRKSLVPSIKSTEPRGGSPAVCAPQ